MSSLHQPQPDTKAGFTLPEVLVALFFFTLLGLGMLQISGEVYYRETLHRDTLAATALAKFQVEELLRAGYADPQLLDPDGGNDVAGRTGQGPTHFPYPDHADLNNPLDAEGGTTGPRKFTRVWNVGADIPLPGIKTVTVLVGWRDARGHPHIVSQTIQLARLE